MNETNGKTIVITGASDGIEEDAMPVEECARLIVDGMRRRREVVMTARRTSDCGSS